MNIESINAGNTAQLSQDVAVSMLKKNMDFQQQAVTKLLQALPAIQDPALGRNIDTTA